MVTCAVVDCKSSSGKTSKAAGGITFHRFPKDAERRSKWKRAMNRKESWHPTDHSTVCSKHFVANDFYVTENGLRRLSADALPSVHMFPSKEDPIPDQNPISTCLNDTDEVIELKNKVRRLEEIAESRRRKIRVLWTDRKRLRKKLEEMKLMVKHLVQHNKFHE